MESFEIVLGTYENLLIGYRLIPSVLKKSYDLETSFTDDSHRGALRCVTISPTGILASSSTDDSIRLHSLKKRKEVGLLFEHNGTVNSMVFYSKNHMFSASEDGTICLWQSRNWELMRTLKGHKSHVMAVAVHPSGKLGLSIGRDRSFVTWDLLTGKLAFQRKLTEAAQNIYFTPTGDHYILAYNKRIEVCSLGDTKVVKEISLEWRINTVAHVQDNIFAVGGDDREILLFDVLEGEQVMSLDAAKKDTEEFKSRVRCISVVDQEEEKFLFLATAAGDIKAFTLDLDEMCGEEIFSAEARVRVTAMGVYNSAGAADEQEPQSKIVRKKEAELEDADDKLGEDSESEEEPEEEVDDEDDDNESESADSSESSPVPSPPKVKKRKREQVSPRDLKIKKGKAKSQRTEGATNGGVLVKSKKKEKHSKSKIQADKKLKLKQKHK